MNDKGMTIAKEHLNKMNPSLWDGNGDQPGDFNPIICTYSIDDDSELDISFEKDEQDGWIHLCELRDKNSSCKNVTTFRIHSFNISHTILPLFKKISLKLL